ncbi:Alpha-ribazole-5'-phosphate phosphatase [Thermodesulfovibrio sp. N1]|uniref:histidine phosphatase family protein n=1 Tax=unclassified Thermodesulfovibrio TaxID=2645936 RepID=UPI00083AFB77|nr:MULTISPECIES: histidine phosphatase family protein [unclassified Thermodesulfovibrio]MDI1472729.1 histidine phosphatase family protein [Thermodesulfovibrio sp. 1176]ODA44466.1 Alpha-ribazole-5'-phosphate phosphatase [Thermodesulfovibrio sp. N1]
MKPECVLYLLRHGETEGPKKVYKGHIDVPLSENGIEQVSKVAENLKKFLSRYEIDRRIILSSPLNRAIKTAEIIGKILSTEYIPMEILKERSFGRWEGMSIDEIISLYPDEFERWRQNPALFSPPDGESTMDVSKRAKKVINEILKLYKGFQVIITAHGGINRVILCNIMNIPLEKIFCIEQDFACLNIIEFYDGYPVVKLLNGVFWR